MAKLDIMGQFGSMFGFSKWKTGLGSLGNFTLWLFVVIIASGLFIWFVYWLTMKAVYKHKIKVFGMVGGKPQLKWKTLAKPLPVGKAGDKLFYLKIKRMIPPPTIQMGINEWWFWEREDGELINIGIEDIDEKQKRLGIQFVETDMRMQRLGIEKNLAFRLQKQTFWEKYGDKIINIGFYMVISILVIIMFVQWRKTIGDVAGLANAISAHNTCPPCSAAEVESTSTGSGTIPAIALILLNKYKIWRLRK